LYKKDGKIAARNRRRRTEQEGISLAEYRSELITALGKKIAAREISKLKVYRAVKRMKPAAAEIAIARGSTVVYDNRRVAVKGIADKGATLLLEGYKQHIPAKECRLLTRNSGIVCL
jgi:hypothetical protein